MPRSDWLLYVSSLIESWSKCKWSDATLVRGPIGLGTLGRLHLLGNYRHDQHDNRNVVRNILLFTVCATLRCETIFIVLTFSTLIIGPTKIYIAINCWF